MDMQPGPKCHDAISGKVKYSTRTGSIVVLLLQKCYICPYKVLPVEYMLAYMQMFNMPLTSTSHTLVPMVTYTIANSYTELIENRFRPWSKHGWHSAYSTVCDCACVHHWSGIVIARKQFTSELGKIESLSQ